MIRKDPPQDALPDELAQHLARLDEETLRRDQAERERIRKEQAILKTELAKALQARSFADRLWQIGIGFAILIAALPSNPNKAVLYLCSLIAVLTGAFWRDRENKKVARLLPLASEEDLTKAAD